MSRDQSAKFLMEAGVRICERAMALVRASEARYEERSTTRERRLREADKGNIWSADDPERVAKRFAHVQALEFSIGRPYAPTTGTPKAPSAAVETAVARLAQERTIGRDDLVAPQFLRLAIAASRSVCRITVRGPSGVVLGYGTGTLVGPGVLLTNHHVLEHIGEASQSEVTFGFESGTTSAEEERTFSLQPQQLFITDEALDFTFVAVAPADHRGQALQDLGWISLNQQEGKVINGEYVNVIQHPNGGPKMFALRENRIVDVLANYLHYAADTAPGSSGAPVFNDQFEIVALHHSGVPARDDQGRILNRDGLPWTEDQGESQVEWKANEGVRVSMLVERARSIAKTGKDLALLSKAFDVAHSVPRLDVADSAARNPAGEIQRVPVIAGSVATWTIPLTVSVSLAGMHATAERAGGAAAAAQAATLAAAPSIVPSVTPAMKPTGASPELMRAVEHAKDAFKSFPDVLRVRAGWQFAAGWITDNAAIVVTVGEKKSTATLNEKGEPKLPSSFDGFPVDVRQASAEELYELQRIGTGLVVEERTPTPTYVKPDNLSLPRIKERMKLTVHVGPEQGWPVLNDFLRQTDQCLTVAMYDFGAPHIVDAIEERLGGNGASMQLVIQYGASIGDGAKANDLDDADTVKHLAAALGDKFESQWANVGQAGSLWASAYHIKVAIRDSSAFWLSSGNWQSSNQAPDAPPADDTAARKLLTDYNREWHVVVENTKLAHIFESYIQYDFQQSQGFVPRGAPDAFEVLDLLAPDLTEVAREIRTFDPLAIDRVVDVQPVLTPDNYASVVLPLIEGANSTIFFQNQYINESLDSRAEQDYIPLVEALGKKMRQGLDVRIILRGDYGVEARHIEFLKSHGINMTQVRWRNRSHTKGIIVDSARVLLGSHNWSYDGTVLNRDASLLFYDAEIAKYLEHIFIYDWETWSRKTVSIRQGKPSVAEAPSPNELAQIRTHVARGDFRVRRLFHADD